MTFILDAHLLLLLVVGLISPEYISKHRRLQSYTIADFALLQRMLGAASKIVVTPNILTEASNLAGYIAEPARSQVYQAFRRLVDAVFLEERYVESRKAVAADEFIRLGLTDAALLTLASEAYVLLTADLDLYLSALRRGLKAENFNHHRDL